MPILIYPDLHVRLHQNSSHRNLNSGDIFVVKTYDAYPDAFGVEIWRRPYTPPKNKCLAGGQIVEP